MNRRLVSVLLFALVVALVASITLYHLILSRVQNQQGHTVATNRLLVAKRDIQVGGLIGEGDVDEVAWGAPIPEESVKSRQELVGRGVIAPIFQNEPFLLRRLAPKGAGAGLAATIPVGMRAVALRVNEVVGLAGFVVPGMRVDVLMSGNAPNSDQARYGTLCRTILQNIQVLSAGQKLDKTADGKPESAQVVNLLVTPEQAEILNLAMSETKVQLVLRNPLDTTPEKTPGISIAGLLGVPAGSPLPKPAANGVPPAPAPPRLKEAPKLESRARSESEGNRVEIFRGIKKSEETFDLPTRKN